MVNFEVASCSNFQDNREKIFPDAEVGGGAGGINAICSRWEVADNVISGYNVETFLEYHVVNLYVASFRSFPEERNQSLYALTTVRHFGSHFLGQEAKLSNDLHNNK